MTNSTGSCRILIADDHEILRAGIRNAIETESHLSIIGEAADAEGAIEKCKQLQPDIAILDFSMPHGGAIRVIREIRKMTPAPGILIFTMHREPATVRQAMEEGADGYLHKGASTAEILKAIAAVSKRKTFLDSSLAAATLDSMIPTRRNRLQSDERDRMVPKLSERESSVLKYLAKGFTNAEIAQTLEVSVKTVETFRSRIGTKLGLKKRSDIVAYALARKLITEES